MGTPVGENSFDFVLLPNNAFFEFLPYSENDDAVQTVLPHECEPEKLYEIVFTNFSGLYRYRMGDVLHMKGFWKESPVFEFAFRRNQALNIAGEKMSVRQLELAVQKLKAYAIQIEAYSFGVSLEQLPAKYFALFVLEEGQTSIQNKNKKEDLGDILDTALSEVNRDYMDLRGLGYLDKPAVYVTDRDRYEKMLDRVREGHRHNKPLHILSEDVSKVLFTERSDHHAE